MNHRFAHPFQQIPAQNRRPIFLVSLITTLLIMFILNVLGAPLQTEQTPAAIVSYEFAGDVPTAQAMLDAWDGRAKIYAGFNLGFDYLFMAAYSTTIALGMVWTADALQLKGTTLSAVLLLAWSQWPAALLDAVENAALLVMLFNQPADPWPQIAFWCAAFKFALVLAGIFVTLAGAAWFRLRK
jgi:hypothetical protein